MSKTKTVRYWCRWIFDCQAIAVKAISEIIKNGNVTCSFGKGDIQYEGFEADEGTFTIKPYKSKVSVTWASTPQPLIRNYWMSPYCFDKIKTYDFKLKSSNGEAITWGSK